MTKFFNNKAAWKEAFIDTGVGFIVNFPINILMLFLCNLFSAGVLTTSIVLSVTFTIIAILRKYIIRVYFTKPS